MLLRNAVKQIIEKLPKTAPWGKISNEDLLNHLGDLTEHWIIVHGMLEAMA
jgi:hypothetical protein